MWTDSIKGNITLQFQAVDTKKHPQISGFSDFSNELSQPKCKQYQIKDEIHGIKTTKRKTNRDLLSKEKLLKVYGDIFDTLPWKLHVEVDKCIGPVQNVLRKMQVAMKEDIMKIIDELIEQKIVAKVNTRFPFIRI